MDLRESLLIHLKMIREMGHMEHIAKMTDEELEARRRRDARAKADHNADNCAKR